jgi:hypothetical protein
MPPINEIAFQIPLTPFFLFVVFAIIVFVWGLFTWIIQYHWKSYSANTIHLLSMNLIYFVGSAILLAGMVLFAFLYYGSATL